MQVPIDSVKVKERVRKDIGDLRTLTDSMQKYGQLSPIVITRSHELVAGHRRLMAAQQLGWQSIEATFVTAAADDAKLEIELQENVYRKDFTPEELLAGYGRLEKLRHPGVLTRIGRFIRKPFEKLFSWARQLGGRRASAALPPAGEEGDWQDRVV